MLYSWATFSYFLLKNFTLALIKISLNFELETLFRGVCVL